MKKLLLALLALAAAVTWGVAQNVTMPPPAGTTAILCAFNSSPATITSANVGFVNCDANGNVKTVGSGTPSGTQDVNIKQVQGAVPSATNQLWVSPATASTPWAISAASGSVASGAVASGAFASGSLAAGSMVDYITTRGTVAAGTAAANSTLVGGVYTSTAPTLTTTQQAALQLSARGGALLGSQYPAGSTPITISGTGTTAATTATLATGGSVTTHICGFSIRANATAAATANSTVTGTITGTLNYTQWTAPLASGIGITEQIFSPCIPASAVNTSIAVISAAPGAGGVVSVTAWGYTL